MKNKLKIYEEGTHKYTIVKKKKKTVFKRSNDADWIDMCKGEKIMTVIQEGEAVLIIKNFSGEELLLNKEQTKALSYILDEIS